MIFGAFFLHILLFVSLLYLTNFRKNYFNPVYFLLYANYFYFFILWILWYFVDKSYVYSYQYGYYLTLLHGMGLVFGVVYSQNFNKQFVHKISQFIPSSKFENISSSSIFIVFVLISLCIVYITYDIYQTLNPLEILIKIEASKQLGTVYTSGLMYFIKPFQLLVVLLFCFLVFKAYQENKKFYIFFALIILVTLSFALGSKSMVIFPIFYIFMIRHNFFKKVKLSRIVITGLLILLFIPLLELIRQDLLDRLDDGIVAIIKTLVGRINMQLYLTEFSNKSFYGLEYPNSLYHFFTYFIPRELLVNIGISDKPIPFGLAYTRYVTDRPDVYMTVAGTGIAEWIHNFAIFGSEYIIYLGILLGGLLSGIINGILFLIIKQNIALVQKTKFIVILIFIHIGTFFEFGFSATIGTIETVLSLIFIILITNILIINKKVRA